MLKLNNLTYIIKSNKKTIYINIIIVIFSLILIEIATGYFLQYRSSKGLQIINFSKVIRRKLFRITQKKIFLEKPSKKIELVKNLRLKNKNKYYPYYFYFRQLHNPDEKFWFTNPIKKNIVYCKKKFEDKVIIYQSNELGLRKVENSNKDEKYDYIFIGDSITEGECVDTKYTIPNQISLIKNLNTFNAGRSHSGPLYQLGMLTEILKFNNTNNFISTNGTFVWIMFAGNDLSNLAEEKTTLLANYLNENFSQNYFQNIKTISKSQEKFLDEMLEIVDKYGESSLFHDVYGESTKSPWIAKRNNLLLYKTMKEFDQRVKEAGNKLKIILITNKKYPDYSSEKLTENLIEKNCKSLKLSCKKISLNSEDVSIKEDEMVGPHFTEEGYQKISKIISENI